MKIENLIKEIREDPENSKNWLNLRLEYEMTRDIKKIEEFCDEILRLYPKNRFVPVHKGIIRRMEGKFVIAIMQFQELVMSDPDNTDAWNELIFTFEVYSDTNRIRIFSEIFKNKWNTNEYILLLLGIAAKVDGDYVLAEKFFREGLIINSQNPKLLNELTFVYMNLGRFEKQISTILETRP
jgi:tetratricopeptide (TPR) repeat protein